MHALLLALLIHTHHPHHRPTPSTGIHHATPHSATTLHTHTPGACTLTPAGC